VARTAFNQAKGIHYFPAIIRRPMVGNVIVVSGPVRRPMRIDVEQEKELPGDGVCFVTQAMDKTNKD
jgi:hypothetical protein